MKRVAITLVIAACGPVVGDAGDASTTTDATTSPSMTSAGASASSSSESDATSPPAETTAPDTSTNEVTTADDGVASIAIIDEPDIGDGIRTCDIFAQDCPPGEKCMPYENWSATRCSPLDPAAKHVGEPCTVVGSAASGIDDCEVGALCWYVDAQTNAGECIAMCQGSEANPICSDPCTRCTILDNDGALFPCLRQCNPIAQDCAEGQACRLEGDAFHCVPNVQTKGPYGAPCGPIYDCDVGLVCADAQNVPECDNETGCCTPFCDVDAGDECDSLPGTACVPWFEPGEGSEGCLDAGMVIGACMVPR